MKRIVRAWLREKRRRVALEAEVEGLRRELETALYRLDVVKRIRADTLMSLGPGVLLDELPFRSVKLEERTIPGQQS